METNDVVTLISKQRKHKGTELSMIYKRSMSRYFPTEEINEERELSINLEIAMRKRAMHESYRYPETYMLMLINLIIFRVL